MSGLFRNILEIGLGMLYLIGAIFNSLYTFRHGREFYGGFAGEAWLIPARGVIRNAVIPRARVFTILLIVFQVIVAFFVMFHVLNGIRIILLDTWPKLLEFQREATWLQWLIFIPVYGMSVMLMIQRAISGE